uniref:Uncharacterized protein n=1 Tax=Helianthus annuus TaxID=4232 RepID=A0A251SCM7_HELAN
MVKLLDLVCLYAGWGILISGHFRLFYLYRKLKVQCLDHSIDLRGLSGCRQSIYNNLSGYNWVKKSRLKVDL